MSQIGMARREMNSYEGTEFYGKVVDNNDPLKLSRVKVEIPELYGEGTPHEDLPWAEPPTNASNIGQTSTSGSFGVLAIGSEVYVVLRDGVPDLPRVSRLANNTRTQKAGLETIHYPNRYGFTDETGTYGVVDKESGDAELCHESESRVQVRENGDVQVVVENDYTTFVKGDKEVTVDKDLNVIVKGNVSITVTGNASIEAQDVSATVKGNLAVDTTGTTSITNTGPISMTSAASITISSPMTTVNG